MRWRDSIREVALASLLAAVVLVSAGCAADRPQAQQLATTVAAAMPPAVEIDSARVIDQGDLPEACIMEFQSYPPQCGGEVALSGWDWDSSAGTFEQSGDARWGTYHVTGFWDESAQSLVVVSASPAPQPAEPDDARMLFPTRCDPPRGGWKIVDEARASQETLHAAVGVASELEGFATTWLDRTLVPQMPEGTATLDVLHNEAIHAGRSILNVGVRAHVDDAEARLREVWGGALCVFDTDFTQAELDARAQEIMAAHSVLSAATDGVTGTIEITVAFDHDGALQQEMDERYGSGVVLVSSYLALVG